VLPAGAIVADVRVLVATPRPVVAGRRIRH
jgi:hypothetical protein